MNDKENKINVNLDEFVFANPLPVLVCNREGKIIFINPAAEDFAKDIGLKDEELKRLFPMNFDHKIKTLRKVEKINQVVDIKHERFKGRLIFNYACFKNSENIFISFQDVTKQKKLEEIIQESAIEKMKLLNKIEEALERQQKLNLMQEFLLGAENLEGKLKRITETVVETFSAHFCRVWIIKPGDLCYSGCIHGSSGSKEMSDECLYGKRCLHLMASAGRYTHIDGDHRRVPIGSYKIGPIAAGRISKFITNDVTHDPLVHDPEWAKKEKLVSFAGYQLSDSAGKPFGVLALFAKHPISPEESANLEGIANTTAQVIQTERAKENLRKSEESMGSILKTVGEGIIALDQDSTIIFINWEICNIFAYSEEELIGKKLQMLMPEKYRDKHSVGLKRYLENGQPKILGQRVEMEGLRKDGSIFPLELKVEETKRDNGSIRIFTGAIRDITYRSEADEKQAELYEQLKSAKQELENANVELSDKIEKLEMFQKVTMGRENRIIELKEKVKELEEKLEG